VHTVSLALGVADIEPARNLPRKQFKVLTVHNLPDPVSHVFSLSTGFAPGPTCTPGSVEFYGAAGRNSSLFKVG